VRVFGVEVVGTALMVDVYGGDNAVVSTVNYRICSDDAELDMWQKFVAELMQWTDDQVALSYVRFDSGAIRLIPEGG
jgi:hypothetical protein